LFREELSLALSWTTSKFLELDNLEIPKFHGQNDELTTWFLRWNKPLLVTTLITKDSSRLLFQDWKVVHFNSERILKLIEERKEKKR